MTWDGTQRLDTWLITYGGADDSEYSRAVGALMLIAAVRRVRQPGCKFDEMVVFESQQGWLKSSAVQALCVNPEWFSDCLPLSASIKEVIEQTEGKWIIEVPELAGLPGTQVEKLKAMLSRQTDSSRAAYGHHRADRPRQFILFGTTNDSEYLRDMTGNRRFWPVKLTKRFDVDGVTSARDQLWAEAAEREANGESIRMPEHLWDAAAKEQEQRLVVDPWEDEIARMLALTPTQRRIPTSEIWSWLGKTPVNVTKADSMRLTAVMTRLGWRKITVTNSQGHAAVGFGKDP